MEGVLAGLWVSEDPVHGRSKVPWQRECCGAAGKGEESLRKEEAVQLAWERRVTGGRACGDNTRRARQRAWLP